MIELWGISTRRIDIHGCRSEAESWDIHDSAFRIRRQISVPAVGAFLHEWTNGGCPGFVIEQIAQARYVPDGPPPDALARVA